MYWLQRIGTGYAGLAGSLLLDRGRCGARVPGVTQDLRDLSKHVDDHCLD
jgi:hypothetical protein